MLKRTLKWVSLTGVVLVLVMVASFAYLYKVTDLPDPNADFTTETTMVYYADGKQELGHFATQDRESIPLSDMPQHLRDAVVAAENRTFWTDEGIDPKGILRALFSNASGGSTQGASTITQQYIKVLYLSQERTWSRKIKEAILSLKIQRQVSKSDILQGYLNTIYFGRGAYGVQAAAQAYFDKPAKRLDLRECAVLAAVLNNPAHFDPAGGKANRQALRDRYQYVLDGMVTMDTVSAADAEKAGRRLPKFPEIPADSQYGLQRGHMLTLVRDELHALNFTDEQIDGGGLRVTTTFTEKDMAAAKDGVMAQRPEGFSPDELHIAVASVEPGTGALRGFYAGQDYLDSQINWAKAGGMAGSTFKPFAMVAAIRAGLTLRSTFDGNSPMTMPDGTSFRNEQDNSYGSGISMVYAAEESVNTAFIDMTNQIDHGPEKVVTAAEDLGIPAKDGSDFGIPSQTPDLTPDLGVSLGTAQVSPINMANAYATLANKGVAANVHVVERVTDRQGNELYHYGEPPRTVLDDKIAADVTYALTQVVESGTGTAALELDRPAAGKTGTATNANDEVSSAWFVGYTPQLSTAVMYVRGNGREQLDGWLPEFFGGSYPARTWTDVMTRALDGEPVKEFPPPAYVDRNSDNGTYVPEPTDDSGPVAPPPPTGDNGHNPGGPHTTNPEPTTPPPTTQQPTTHPPTTQPPTTPPPSTQPPTTQPPTTPPPTTTKPPTQPPSSQPGPARAPVAPGRLWAWAGWPLR